MLLAIYGRENPFHLTVNAEIREIQTINVNKVVKI